MDHLFAVGRVTEAAAREIKRVGGSVTYVSSVPPVQLVSIPDPTFENIGYPWMLRIKRGRMSLLWRGNSLGPELTTIDKTVLESERNEPRTPQAASDENLDDSDGYIF